jgi:hypothetical protein
MPAEHVLTPDDKCPCGKPQTGSGYCSYECYSKHEPEPASMGGPLSEAEAAAARIRAYLDACTDANSFGREIRWELRDADGNPYNLPRVDLVAVLDGLAAEAKDCEILEEGYINAMEDYGNQLTEVEQLRARVGVLEGQLATARGQLALVDKHIAYQHKLGRRISETDDQLEQQRLLGQAEARKALAYALAGSPHVDEEGINCDY